MLRLRGVEFRLRLAAESLAAVVADETAGFFAGLQGGWFGGWVVVGGVLGGGVDLLERFILVLLEPFQGALYCAVC